MVTSNKTKEYSVRARLSVSSLYIKKTNRRMPLLGIYKFAPRNAVHYVFSIRTGYDLEEFTTFSDAHLWLVGHRYIHILDDEKYVNMYAWKDDLLEGFPCSITVI